jgi:S-adenosylmethionine synthetase
MTRLVLEGAALDPARRALEVVERKGAGHPDTLCDAAAEAFSRGLARLYLARTGRILHHNVDKALLSAGSTEVRFGGGAWKEKVTAVLGGRATTYVGDDALPIEDVARAAVREALAAVPRLPSEQVRVQAIVHPVAADLRDIFGGAEPGPPRSNDTSIGVGFAPYTRTERVALAVEQRLNAEDVKREHPAFGPDVKVMAVRDGERLRLTVAVALVAEHVPDAAAHARAVAAARELAEGVAREHGFGDAEVRVNAGDAPGRMPYLTLSGSSVESGDDGQVGRGNRVSGLITPMRPMTLEAFAGKNPVTHVGKLLSVSAGRVAEACAALPGVRAAECVLVSEIGRPVTEPQIAGIRLDAPPDRLPTLRPEVDALLARELAQIPALWRALVG